MAQSEVVTEDKVFPSLLTLVDFSKGLAICCIYLTHFRVLDLGWQGVHLFIVFSGLTLTYSCLKQNHKIIWKKWYLKRLRRILPAYWFVVFLGYLAVAISISWQGNSLLQSLWSAKQTLFFDLTLLKAFYYREVATFPNVSLWFIPLILSFYLAFPVLYQWIIKCKSAVHLLLFLSGMISLEFAYRALSILYLDGRPIGYARLGSDLPLDRLPDQFPFQLEAPFAFFPSRIGEFVLGMVLGLLLIRCEKKLSKIIFDWRIAIFGFLVWLLANYIRNLGFWGWISADFLIAFGLTLWVLKIASLLQAAAPSFFSKMSKIGFNSYYIFLIHAIFIQMFLVYLDGKMGYMYLPFSQGSQLFFDLISFAFILGLTVAGSKILKRLDHSKFADWLASHTISKLLN